MFREQVTNLGIQNIVSDLWIRTVYRTLDCSLGPEPFYINLCDPPTTCPCCRQNVAPGVVPAPSSAAPHHQLNDPSVTLLEGVQGGQPFTLTSHSHSSQTNESQFSPTDECHQPSPTEVN